MCSVSALRAHWLEERVCARAWPRSRSDVTKGLDGRNIRKHYFFSQKLINEGQEHSTSGLSESYWLWLLRTNNLKYVAKPAAAQVTKRLKSPVPVGSSVALRIVWLVGNEASSMPQLSRFVPATCRVFQLNNEIHQLIESAIYLFIQFIFTFLLLFFVFVFICLTVCNSHGEFLAYLLAWSCTRWTY